jgi:hypothetical protein
MTEHTDWTSDELDAFGAADVLAVWAVRAGDDRYVRAANGRTAGRTAAWLRRARVTAKASATPISAAGSTPPTGPSTGDALRPSSPVPSIVRPEVRAATRRLVPR